MIFDLKFQVLVFLRIKILGVGHFIHQNNLVPGKINILSWRIWTYRLPKRANIHKREIALHSILCMFCDEQIEDEDYLFALCPLSRNIWNLIRKWWGLDVIPLDIALNVLEMADNGDLNLSENISSLFDVVQKPQICESNSHYGYECSQRVPLVYEPEPCYIQNFSENDYSHDLLSVNLLVNHHCCYKCGHSLNKFFCHLCICEFCGNGAHVGYNCPAQVPSFQTLPSFPQQYPCCEDCGVLPEADHYQPPQYTFNHLIFNAHNDLLNSQNMLMEQVTSMCEIFGQFIQKKHEEEQAANARYWKIPACCDDDDDYNFAITPNERVDSLSMGDEHLNTIQATESDEFINDDQSLYDEDVTEKIFSNPLFEEEIIPMKIDQRHDNTESDLVESLRTHDYSLIISSKIDSLLDEFAGKLTLLKSIPPRIDETDCDPEEDIRLIERLLYDNSSPHPPEEFVSDNSDAEIESFSPFPNPIKDSDSLMEEVDLSFTPDELMPSGIEEDDDDSERDILILEELLDNYSLSLPENESFRFDIPLFSRPPAKPPDGDTGI
nr:reverse transcriptase domain, reverse transcriptase zinc-binding domain protein [Tanacetum cinerariifolium]